jgi:hypothetical protein
MVTALLLARFVEDRSAVVQTAMLAGASLYGCAIFTHPTMAEGLNVLFANAPCRNRRQKPLTGMLTVAAI